jgi:hypothetical protein
MSNSITKDFIESHLEACIKALDEFGEITKREETIARFAFSCGMDTVKKFNKIMDDVFKKEEL